MIGLFCKRALWQRRHSAKETYNFKEPTNRSACAASHKKKICDFWRVAPSVRITPDWFVDLFLIFE